MQTIRSEIVRHLPDNINEPARLFHGRGQTVPGYSFLTIDWYPPLALITLYDEKSEAWLDALVEQLKLLLDGRLTAVAVQVRGDAATGGRLLYGEIPTPFEICEDGLVYWIDPLAGQNIGFFPDMRSGRKLIRSIAEDRTVLNLFAYSCAFSVAAIAGGARKVVNLDMNRSLLDRGRENHKLNGHDLRKVNFLAYNLFKSFGRLKKSGPFDLVIIDPPIKQGASFQAMRDWPKILRRLPDLLANEAEIVAAVSAPELGKRFLLQQFTEHLPQAELLSETTADPDFPEADPDKGLQILRYRWQSA